MHGTLEAEMGKPPENNVLIPLGSTCVEGILTLPAGAGGVVCLVHDLVGSRDNPQLRDLTIRLQTYGLGTFLFDLLASEEERNDFLHRTNLYQTERLSFRLRNAMRVVQAKRGDMPTPFGCLGIGAGAAAAMVAAAQEPVAVRSVVCWGGRPDEAGNALFDVVVPTLFVAAEGAADVEHTREACAKFPGKKHLEILSPPARDALDAPASILDRVGEVAGTWLARQLPRSAAPAA